MKCGSVGPRFGMIVLAIICVSLPGARELQGQGGEPRSFAISGAKVVPVSGPVLEAATVVVSHGLIVAVGKEVTIPADAWVIEGKGLTVYPGFIDAFTDVGIAAAQSDSEGKGKQQPLSKGPEDRPSTTPWRNAADELNINDPRIETWRSAGFTTTVSAPKGGIFPGQAAVLDLAGERAGDLVVKSPVAIPVNLQPLGGFGSGFPDSVMGVLAYVHQLWIDTDWLTKSEAAYGKNPRG